MKRRINETDINRIAKKVMILKEQESNNTPMTTTGLINLIVELISNCKKNPQTCIDQVNSVYLKLPPDVKQKIDNFKKGM
jgi:hypothetical protein